MSTLQKINSSLVAIAQDVTEGFFFITHSSMAFLAGFAFNYADNMGIKFTYSYDMEMSGALMGTGGAHEISLILDFNNASLFGGNNMGMGRMGGRHFEAQNPWECVEF